jgi:hypothetical protein
MRLKVVACLMVTLCACIGSSAQQPEPSKTQEGNAKPQPDNAGDAKGGREDVTTVYNSYKADVDANRAKDDKSNWKKFLDNAVTDPIVGLTVALLLLAVVQFTAYLTEIKDTRTIERAYVGISLPDESLILKPDEEFRVRVRFINLGHTPADVVCTVIDLRRNVMWPNPPRPSPPKLHPPRTVLMPGQHIEGSERITWMIFEDGAQIMKGIRAGTEHMTVSAWVIYRDRFGKFHRSGFAARYHHRPIDVEGVAGVVFLPDVTESYEEDWEQG